VTDLKCSSIIFFAFLGVALHVEEMLWFNLSIIVIERAGLRRTHANRMLPFSFTVLKYLRSLVLSGQQIVYRQKMP